MNLYHTGKLRLDIVNLKHKIEDNFKEIGEKVYKHRKTEDDEPSSFCFEDKSQDKKGLGEVIKLCEDTDKLEALVKNKEAEIEKIVEDK